MSCRVVCACDVRAIFQSHTVERLKESSSRRETRAPPGQTEQRQKQRMGDGSITTLSIDLGDVNSSANSSAQHRVYMGLYVAD